MEDMTGQGGFEGNVPSNPVNPTPAPMAQPVANPVPNPAARAMPQQAPVEISSGIKASLIVDYIFWVITAIILLRFAFKLIGANSHNAFVGLIFQATGPVVDFFKGIVGDVTSGSMVIEFSSLISILILWLIYKAVLRLITIAKSK